MFSPSCIFDMVKAMYANLGLLVGKFNVDRLCERSFNLVFKNKVCEAKCMECPCTDV